MDLSVIYPVHISFQSRYIIKRIQRCLLNTQNGLPEAEHLIALSGTSRYIKKAKKLINDLNLAIKVIDYQTPTEPYSPGIARNFAVKHSTTNNLLFWDIDLLGSPQLFNAIPKHIEEINKQSNVFHMYPCMYLCKEYTKSFTKDFEQIWQDASNLKVNSIEHFAMATSTILCNKQHFLDIGAFDEEFVGHMGEDLELLNRLAIAYGKYPFEPDHSEDHPSKIPSELKGYRKLFSIYGNDELKHKRFSCHLNHSTRLSSKYKKANSRNRNLLNEKIKNISRAIDFKTIRKSEWSSYLTTAPNIKKGYLEVAFRKTRKLASNPKVFLKDLLDKKSTR